MFKSRKRVILDRGPSWPDYDKAEPFMIRYYVLFRKRPKWFPFNILVHKILKEDRGDLHDHYWSYITIILKGGYWETTNKGTFWSCLLYTSPSPRDGLLSRMPSSA